MSAVTVAPLAPQHEAAWRRLYRGYRAFYKNPPDEAVLDRLWAWLSDPAHPMECLVALRDGVPVGLAHVCATPSPIRAADIGFLNDLFVDPEVRGGRVGEALLSAVADLARDRGWPLVRWITADDNYRARTLYDRVASKAGWNVYEMKTP